MLQANHPLLDSANPTGTAPHIHMGSQVRHNQPHLSLVSVYSTCSMRASTAILPEVASQPSAMPPRPGRPLSKRPGGNSEPTSCGATKGKGSASSYMAPSSHIQGRSEANRV